VVDLPYVGQGGGNGGVLVNALATTWVLASQLGLAPLLPWHMHMLLRRYGKLLDACDSHGRAPGVDGAEYDPRPPRTDRSNPDTRFAIGSPSHPGGILTCSLAGEGLGYRAPVMSAFMDAIGGKADIGPTPPKWSLMTLNRHRAASFAALRSSHFR